MAARSTRSLHIDEICEIREALANRRRARQSFERAWAATLNGLPEWQHEQLWADAWQWRLAYERKGSTAIAKLLDVLEGAGERERHVVLG